MISRISKVLVVMLLSVPAISSGAFAQADGEAGARVPKGATPGIAKSSPAKKAAPSQAAMPDAKIVAKFGEWALVCVDKKDQNAKERCSLIQALVERDTDKLVFRLVLAYGPKGNLVLQVDSPTGVALQRGIEFSPDLQKIYRLAYQTCVPQACRAVLMIADDLKGEMEKSPKGSLTVYALNGQAVQTATDFTGLGDGLAALDKRRATQ
jgi:invasion protein IalB